MGGANCCPSRLKPLEPSLLLQRSYEKQLAHAIMQRVRSGTPAERLACFVQYGIRHSKVPTDEIETPLKHVRTTSRLPGFYASRGSGPVASRCTQGTEDIAQPRSGERLRNEMSAAELAAHRGLSWLRCPTECSGSKRRPGSHLWLPRVTTDVQAICSNQPPRKRITQLNNKPRGVPRRRTPEST